jgi:hypothetical protein
VTVLTNDEGVWGQNDVAEVAIPDGAVDTGENRVKVVIGGGEDTFRWEQ